VQELSIIRLTNLYVGRIICSVNPAAQIREAREAAGLTQLELAEKAHLTQATISRIEAGTIVPRLDTLQRIADALGTSTAALLEVVG
jgi:transcriptional regulator with XRE-family HTH domain